MMILLINTLGFAFDTTVKLEIGVLVIEDAADVEEVDARRKA